MIVTYSRPTNNEGKKTILFEKFRSNLLRHSFFKRRTGCKMYYTLQTNSVYALQIMPSSPSTKMKLTDAVMADVCRLEHPVFSVSIISFGFALLFYSHFLPHFKTISSEFCRLYRCGTLSKEIRRVYMEVI